MEFEYFSDFQYIYIYKKVEWFETLVKGDFFHTLLP